jgi:hypothetical protein
VEHWDHRMTYWRISGHLYPQEVALRSGGDVVVCTATLASALERAGRSSDQFDDDDRRVWLLGADDSLTLVEDHHVADMEQADFDELVEGRGPLSYQVGDAYDPAAAVERHAEWTAAIRAAIERGRK